MNYDSVNVQCEWCQSFGHCPDFCHHPDNIFHENNTSYFRECIYNRMDYFTPDTKIFPCKFFEGSINFFNGRNIIGKLIAEKSNSLLQFQAFEKFKK